MSENEQQSMFESEDEGVTDFSTGIYSSYYIVNHSFLTKNYHHKVNDFINC